MDLFAFVTEGRDDFLAPPLKTLLTIGITHLTAKNNSQTGNVDDVFRAAVISFYNYLDPMINLTTRADVKKSSRRIVGYFTTFHNPQFSQTRVLNQLHDDFVLVNNFLTTIQ